MRNKKIIAKLLVLGVCTSLTAGITTIAPVNAFADTNTTAATEAEVVEKYETTAEWGSFSLGGKNVTDAVAINGIAFTKESDSTVAIASIDNSLVNLNIPETITVNGKVYTVDTIKEGACGTDDNNLTATQKYLETVQIPNTIKNIEGWTFACDKSLREVTFKSDSPITTLPMGIFTVCKSLQKVTLPDGLKRICGFALNGCQSLGSLTLPQGVESIDSYAFLCMVAGSQTDGKEDAPTAKTKFNLVIPVTLESIGVGSLAQSKNNIFVTIKGVEKKTAGGTNFSDLENLIYSGTGVAKVDDSNGPRVIFDKISK